MEFPPHHRARERRRRLLAAVGWSMSAVGVLAALAPAARDRAAPRIEFKVHPPPSPAVSEEALAVPEEPPPATSTAVVAAYPRPVESVLELQVELHRRAFSCGSIDGVMGAQTASALRAWQRMAGVKESGVLDEATRDALTLSAPALGEHVFTAEELATLAPAPTTWLEKSQREALGYATALELVAEHYRASPKFIVQLNPDVDWPTVAAGTRVVVPAVGRVVLPKNIAQLFIWLAGRELEIFNADGTVVAHFPVSIAQRVEKRPVGELHMTVVIPEPNYTFDPAVFPESAEAKELGRKLILAPGPNNPVGVAWIGLDQPSYGIHGTPEPEKVGRTESHGCFRLANWDALTLLTAARVGLPVIVEP